MTPNASTLNSGSDDSQEAAVVTSPPAIKEKPKVSGAKIASYTSPKQRAAAAANAALDSDNSNISQKYVPLQIVFTLFL